MDLVYLSIAVFLVFVLIFITFKTGKTKKLFITTAEVDETGQHKVIEVTRKWNDGFNDAGDMKLYHQGDKKIWLAKHWILKIEEV